MKKYSYSTFMIIISLLVILTSIIISSNTMYNSLNMLRTDINKIKYEISNIKDEIKYIRIIYYPKNEFDESFELLRDEYNKSDKEFTFPICDINSALKNKQTFPCYDPKTKMIMDSVFNR